MYLVANFLKIIPFTIIISTVVDCELFSSTSHMNQMLLIQDKLIGNLNRLILKKQEGFDNLQRIFPVLINGHKESLEKTSKNNSLARFQTTKRFIFSWPFYWETIVSVIKNDFELSSEFFKQLSEIKSSKLYPKLVDLKGIASAIIRLQHTYKLKASDLAAGKILNIQINDSMSSSDCYEIGKHTLNDDRSWYSIEWLQKALEFLPSGSHRTEDLQLNILNSLVDAFIKEKDYASAFRTNLKLLEISPTNFKAIRNHPKLKKNSQKQIETNTQVRLNDEKDLNKLINSNENPLNYIIDVMHIVDEYEVALYEAVCRGDVRPSEQFLSQLKCKYVTNNLAFFKIAPFKAEEISLKPYIVMYHDAISESEIEILKQMAEPELERATVHSHAESIKNAPSKARISKYAWFKDDSHKCVADISKRVADITGLNMNSSESLQVLNYGIGGYYDLHFDFAAPGDTAFDSLNLGNRIATVMFYMTDVIAGGGTAFPIIKQLVSAKKGSAIVWWNLLDHGEGDVRTKHAACPVLVGSKWVSNKWIHSYGQELLTPCSTPPKNEQKNELYSSEIII